MDVNSVSVSSRDSLLNCWVMENKQHTFISHSGKGISLPRIDSFVDGISVEEVLIENNIPYQRVQTAYSVELELWDGDCYEEEQVTLPLYFLFFNEYRKAAKEYTGFVLTQETVDAANNVLSQVVLPVIEKKVKEKKLQDAVKHIEECMQGKSAAVVDLGVWTEDYLKVNGRKFTIFPVLRKGFVDFIEGEPALLNIFPTDYYAVFDDECLKNASKIILECKADIVGLVIGKGGWQIKQWSQEFGCKQINVVKID